MSDTSNAFSLNGLNRQKNLSGLHARRPENIDQYFTRTSLNIPPMYVRILSVQITDTGNDQYSFGTYPVFPNPEHPSGVRASGRIDLELTDNSFDITNGGSGYSLNDSFEVVNNNNESLGFISVESTGANGSITSVSYSYFDNSVFPTSGNSIVFSDNTSATIDVNSDNYRLKKIVMTNFGHGYQTFDYSTKQPMIHSVALSGAGNGSGHYITTSYAPIVLFDFHSRKTVNYPNKYGKLPDSQLDLEGIHIVLNDTMASP